MIRPTRTTAPAEQPITLTEAKAHLRVEASDDDDMIEALVEGATSHLDGWSGILGRCLVEQEWKASFHCFRRVMRLPFPDVSAATISYFDADDAQQSVGASNFSIKEDETGAFIWFADLWQTPTTFARPDAVQITFTAGYGDAADVPAPIKQAMKLLISHWNENREAVAMSQYAPRELPMAVSALLAPYRRQSL